MCALRAKVSKATTRGQDARDSRGRGERRTLMPCILDMALSGRRARKVRIVLKAWIPPAPNKEATKLMSDTWSDKKTDTHTDIRLFTGHMTHDKTMKLLGEGRKQLGGKWYMSFAEIFFINRFFNKFAVARSLHGSQTSASVTSSRATHSLFTIMLCLQYC